MIFICFGMRNPLSETFFARHETIFFICASGGRFCQEKACCFCVFTFYLYLCTWFGALFKMRKCSATEKKTKKVCTLQ